MISKSPDSSINVIHIHFYFQENIFAETGILRTLQTETEGQQSSFHNAFRKGHRVDMIRIHLFSSCILNWRHRVH